MKKLSEVEETFFLHLRGSDLTEGLVREYRFHPVRRWRFDFAWPDKMIAVEVEGGVWSRGRHLRPEGYTKDAEKYNAATELGWSVYRYTTDMVKSGTAIAQVISVHDKS